MSRQSKYETASAPMSAAENIKNRKRALIKLGSTAAFFGLVAVFVTIAWFTMSKRISASGGEVKVVDYPLIIEVRGDKAENKSYFHFVNEALFGDDDTIYQEGEQSNDEVLQFQAIASKDRIIWEKGLPW